MIQTTKTLDWDKYLKTAAQVVSEGIVMLKNEHQALPLKPHEEIALFGRIQFHYYKSGTGSGGMVNVSKVTNIVDGLQESGIKLIRNSWMCTINGIMKIPLTSETAGAKNHGPRRKCLWRTLLPPALPNAVRRPLQWSVVPPGRNRTIPSQKVPSFYLLTRNKCSPPYAAIFQKWLSC